MNKLYKWELYDKNKFNMKWLDTSRDSAWITSGYVIAGTIKEAKEKISDCFDMDSGKYILNFDLGECFIAPYYVQDNKNQDVFIEEFLLESED